MAFRRLNPLLLPLALLLLFSRPTSAALPALVTSAVSQSLVLARSFLVLSARVQLTKALFEGLDDTTQCFQPEEKRDAHGPQSMDTTACVVRSVRTIANAYLLHTDLDQWFFGPVKDAKKSLLGKAGRLLSRALITEWVLRGHFNRMTAYLTHLLPSSLVPRLVVARAKLQNARLAAQNSKWYRWFTGVGRRPIEVDFLMTIARRTRRIAAEYVQAASHTISAAFLPDVLASKDRRFQSRGWHPFHHLDWVVKSACAKYCNHEETRRARAISALNKFVLGTQETWERVRGGNNKRSRSKVNPWLW
eukprot:GFKZ01008326.1.p1 GENE.GFKZ01008326.1~~GFKZ01008326.1.p1  ORF type:complete len:305 (+),score=17.93 GFKZ01008326.1:237-1151(+)